MKTMEKQANNSIQHTILVVDDEADVTKILKKILAGAGYQVASTNSGEEALGLLENQSFSMIIADHVMPGGMQGAELLSRCKRDYPDMIRVMMTGYTDMEAAAQAVNDAEIYRFIIKPWSKDTLLNIVKGGIEHYEIIHENRRLNEFVNNQNEQLKEQNEKLIDLNRIKTSMTDMIVHDLKGPLGSIMANLDLLSFGTLSEEDRDCLDLSIEGSNEMLRLIMNIINVSKLEEGKVKLVYEEVEIKEMVLSSIDQLAGIVRLKELKISLLIQEDIVNIMVDRDLISRTIVNLLSNAINYSPEGGKIEVRANYSDGKGRVRVSVQDYGQGIPPEQSETIFDRFSLARGDSKHFSYSTGIGLTFCKMAVEAHGGKIWVESEQGRGSNFQFLIPIRPDVSESA